MIEEFFPRALCRSLARAETHCGGRVDGWEMQNTGVGWEGGGGGVDRGVIVEYPPGS